MNVRASSFVLHLGKCPIKRHHSQSETLQSKWLLNFELVQNQTRLSSLILALIFVCPTLLIHSVLGEEVSRHLHTLISEPVKPEWKVHAAAAGRKQPQLTVHS